MGKDASEIRREIEETRSRLGDTVEALAYKSDVPARVKDNAAEKLETVRGTVDDLAGTVTDAASGAKDAAAGAAGTLKGTVAGAVGTVKDTLAGAAGAVKGAAGGVTQAVGNVSERLPDPSSVTGAARRGAGMVMQNPLGLLLGGLAVGFLAGLLIPVTDYERRTVGPIRDDLLDRAQSVGSDAIVHGRAVLQETAQKTIETAQRSFQQHGHEALSNGIGENGLAGAVIEHGRAILEETARTAAETARQAAVEHGRQVISEAKGDTTHGAGDSSSGASQG